MIDLHDTLTWRSSSGPHQGHRGNFARTRIGAKRPGGNLVRETTAKTMLVPKTM